MTKSSKKIRKRAILDSILITFCHHTRCDNCPLNDECIMYLDIAEFSDDEIAYYADIILREVKDDAN